MKAKNLVRLLIGILSLQVNPTCGMWGEELYEFYSAVKRSKYSEQCSKFIELYRDTCENFILKTKDLMKICDKESQKKWDGMLQNQVALCKEERTAAEAQVSGPEVIIKRRMQDLIKQKKLGMSKPLSIKELAVLGQLIKDLEKEGISVDELAKAGAGKKEEL